jgi:hypothetical protein
LRRKGEGDLAERCARPYPFKEAFPEARGGGAKLDKPGNVENRSQATPILLDVPERLHELERAARGRSFMKVLERLAYSSRPQTVMSGFERPTGSLQLAGVHQAAVIVGGAERNARTVVGNEREAFEGNILNPGVLPNEIYGLKLSRHFRDAALMVV